MFNFNPSMTHPFLKYAENTPISNEKVLLLIDDLRQGLSEEDMLKTQDETNRLYSQMHKNVLTCYCIMLHIQCLADISDDRELYDRFIHDWDDSYHS